MVRKNAVNLLPHVVGKSLDGLDYKNELLKAREALRKSEEKYRCIIEAVTDYIYSVRIKDGKPVETIHGENCYAVTGYTIREFEEDPFLWIRMVVEDDHDIVKRQVDQILSGHSPDSIEHRIIRKDGSVLWVENTVVPHHNEQDALISYDGIIRDITRRKLVENELQKALDVSQQRFEDLKKSEGFIKNILESVGEGFVVIDNEYRILSANRAYCEQHNMSANEIEGRHCYEVSHQVSNPCFESGEVCVVKKTFETGIPGSCVHTHYTSKGQPVYLEMRSYPMNNGNRKISSVIETTVNITEKKRLEAQLRHAQKMETVGQLAGGIAHDFNNILSAVINYGNLLLMKLEDEKLRHYISQIIVSAERGTKLTHGLLAFSRKQIIDLVPVKLNEIVSRTEKLLIRVMSEDIEFRTKLTDRDTTVMADSSQIEQVLINLVTNARDAMPDGGSLTISTGVEELDTAFIKTYGYGEPGTYACVSISDTGTGMDDVSKEKIFEPFFTTKEVGKGTGLGLSIVYGTVKQHEGYVNVFSELGRGTTVVVYLPVKGAVLF